MIERLLTGVLFLIFLGLLGVAGAAAFTQYLFQEPAVDSWTRYLKPELRWQRQNLPELDWAFEYAEPILQRSDPRDHFARIEPDLPRPDPSRWFNELVGPRSSGGIGPGLTAQETVFVRSVDEFRSALRAARPGITIELLPGVYRISGRSIPITRAGQPELPIVVRAAEFGSVRLELSMLEGFHVVAPFWVFENFVIDGVCSSDSYCEHAFHVVGNGTNVVIRNNWIANFNAAVKVNGRKGRYPDAGEIVHNAFVNDGPRETRNPVTPVDVVAASNWRVRGNLIADFAKAGGNRISYGAFFKGAGEGNIFEGNLVICDWQHRGGTRIGFSFGGGGSGAKACRDGHCLPEQRGGIARNNVIMNCPNDVGIYLNQSAETLIHNNALIHTRGIDVRFAESDATIVNNVLDGRILARDGASFTESNNIHSPLKAAMLRKVSRDVYVDPLVGDLRPRDVDGVLDMGAPIEEGGIDLCGQAYGGRSPDIGPVQYDLNEGCIPVIR